MAQSFLYWSTGTGWRVFVPGTALCPLRQIADTRDGGAFCAFLGASCGHVNGFNLANFFFKIPESKSIAIVFCTNNHSGDSACRWTVFCAVGHVDELLRLLSPELSVQ